MAKLVSITVLESRKGITAVATVASAVRQLAWERRLDPDLRLFSLLFEQPEMCRRVRTRATTVRSAAAAGDTVPAGARPGSPDRIAGGSRPDQDMIDSAPAEERRQGLD